MDLENRSAQIARKYMLQLLDTTDTKMYFNPLSASVALI